MKKFLSVIIVCLLSALMCVSIYADSAVDSLNLSIDESMSDEIEDIIASCCTEESIIKRAESLMDPSWNIDPVFTVDLDDYCVIWGLCKSFTEIHEESENGTIPANAISTEPIIFIPIRAEINGVDRIVGHVNIGLDVKAKDNGDGYEITHVVHSYNLKNLGYDDFLSGESVHILETIEDFKSNEDYAGCPMMVVSLMDSITDGSGKLILFESEGETYVYDFLNTANLANVSSEIMPLDDYMSARMAYETSDDYTEAGFSGNISIPVTVSSTAADSNVQVIIIPIVSAVCLAAIAVALVIVFRRKAKKLHSATIQAA